MNELDESRLISLEYAVLMFREETWPGLVQGLPEEELSSGIARYLNRFASKGRTPAVRPSAQPTVSTLD